MVLFRKVKADEIDVRIGSVNAKGCSLLLYKDARVDMNILDETVGAEYWQRKHKIIDGNLYCSVGIFIPQMDMWVWKQDVGTESYTEKEKGQASDSFKRACFNWGIGRELYTSPFMWVNARDLATLREVNGKYTCNDRFHVTRLEYDGNKICLVAIVNERTGVELTFGQPQTATAAQREVSATKISKVKADALRALCQEKGVDPVAVCERYGVTAFNDMTEEIHLRAIRALERSSGNNGQN